jgi:hypothetical protein
MRTTELSMTRQVSRCAGLFVFWLAASPCLAQSTIPHLDLVRGLREQGMPDLAMEYLDRLKALKIPEIDRLLPLEYARTRLDLVAEEPEEAKRTALLEQAHQEFDLFLKNNPKDPLAPAAQVELARLVSLQGKGQLSRARRAEGKEQQRKEKAAARGFFQTAADQYSAAAKQIDDQIKALDDQKDKGLKQDLQRTRRRAILDQGINLYDMAQTYDENVQKELIERGETLKKAAKVFEGLAVDPDKPPAAWIANAWLGQCFWEIDERPKAEDIFTTILRERSASAVAAIRLVRAFKVQQAFTDPKGPNRYGSARGLADDWIKAYPAFRNTPEGLAVRYTLARSYHLEGEQGVKRDASAKPVAISGVAEGLFRSAERIYGEIAETDNEYSERATRWRMAIILVRSDAQNKGEVKPESIKNFEEGYLQALVQQARFNEFVSRQSDPGASAEAVKQEERSRFAKIVAFLERALKLATPKDPPREVLEAQLLLAYAYPLANQPAPGAELAEKLARANTKSRHGPQMAALAINANVEVLNKLREQSGDKEKEKEAQALSGKIKELAAFMEKTWPTDSATDSARHTVGYLLRYEKDYLDALKTYARIQPSYGSLAQARLEQGAALFGLVRDVEEANSAQATDEVAARIKKYQELWDKTVKALQDLPAPVPTAPLQDAQSYCNAKVQLGQLYLLEGKQYEKPEQVGKALADQIPKFSQLTGEARDEALYSARALELNGLQGRALAPLKDKKYDAVAKLLDPTIAAIKAEMTGSDSSPGFERLRRAKCDLITLALRSSVQDNKINRARDLLDLLQKNGSTSEGSVQVLRQLVATIRAQIEALRREKKADEEKRLVEGFTQFLDAIAKQEKVPDNMLVFLSQGYAGVDQHGKSVELLERILNSPQPAKSKDGDEEAAKNFRNQVQYRLARAYRLNKQFDKADKLVKELLGTAKQPGPLHRSMEMRKESIYLLEDQNKFRDAVNAWMAYAKQFGDKLPAYPPKDNEEARHRRLYFELFFEAQRCSARAYYSLDAQKFASQKDEGFTRVAQRLVDLETKNPDVSPELKERIREILAEYPELKQKYKAAGGKLLGAGS